MCLYPTYLKNPRYLPNKKNNGIPDTPINMEMLYVPVPCRRCIECNRKKARDWKIRLMEDIKTNTNGKCVTLTFSDESIQKLRENTNLQGYTLDNYIATRAIRLFLERWRKQNGRSLRHWFITELGHEGTHNIHLHGIIWTQTDTIEQWNNIENTWQYGHIYKGQPIRNNKNRIINYTNWVNDLTINYMMKYVTKIDQEHRYYIPIILTSPGIGANYTKTNGDWQKCKYNPSRTKETYTTRTGQKIALPTYYRNKIYTDEEKEKLWAEKLESKIKYVMGTPVDISKNHDTYHNMIKTAQNTNKQLGYGDNTIDYNIKEQENIIRQKKYQERELRWHIRKFGKPPF